MNEMKPFTYGKNYNISLKIILNGKEMQFLFSDLNTLNLKKKKKILQSFKFVQHKKHNFILKFVIICDETLNKKIS